jgi:hypothetical protein
VKSELAVAQEKMEAWQDDVRNANNRRANAERMLTEQEDVNAKQSRRLSEATAVG